MENNDKKSNFLQSEQWREFQKSAGKKALFIENKAFSASIIQHKLPIIGEYFYVSRGSAFKEQKFPNELVDLAKKENAGWIRLDPENEEMLDLIKKNTNCKIVKAPHDMQPKENFIIDIKKTEEALLADMKPKTRYNINLANKKGVKIISARKAGYTEEFLRLVAVTAKRKKVNFHPENYYRKMLEILPENMLKLYVAEYENKIVAANLVVFYGNTATYLHGATDDEYRNVMAPYLLQWQAILDAKNTGCEFYDFGGVSTSQELKTKNWHGITKFKLGFSQNTPPSVFPGSYDIIVNSWKYFGYKISSLLFGYYSRLIR